MRKYFPREFEKKETIAIQHAQKKNTLTTLLKSPVGLPGNRDPFRGGGSTVGHTALLSGPEKNLVGWTEAEESLTPGRNDAGTVPG